MDRFVPAPAPDNYRTVAVMPAYNAAVTLHRTVGDIPPGSVDEVVLVDDCSSDNTVAVARELGLTVIAHEKNTGYGGNQKTCYRRALDSGADFIVMIHPDYQYDSRIIPVAVEILRLTGRAVTAQRAAWAAPDAGAAAVFGLRRAPEDLRARIDARVEEMFARGLVAETQAALAAGLAENPAALHTYSAWDEVPGSPRTRERWGEWLARYRPLVEEDRGVDEEGVGGGVPDERHEVVAGRADELAPFEQGPRPRHIAPGRKRDRMPGRHRRQQFRRRALRPQPSPGHDQHPITGLLHLRQDVRRDQDGVFSGKTLDERANRTDLMRVKSDGRFI